MRKILVVLPLAAVMLAVGLAGAPGIATAKGKPPKSGAGCRPQVSFVFKGSIASADVSSFSMDVEAANKHARSFVGGPATINVNTATRVVRDDAPASLADLAEGDAVTVQVRDCKAANRATMTLVARRVVATSPVAEPVGTEPAA